MGFFRTLACAAALAAPRISAAQDSKTLFTWRDGVLAGGFTALTFAMFPIDRSIARRLQIPGNQDNRFLKSSSHTAEFLAGPGVFLLGASAVAAGHHERWRAVTDLGVHTMEAVVLAGGINFGVKMLAGRARPYVSSDTTPRDFSFARGIRRGDDYESFPSGHTAVAFAAASAISSESRRWFPSKQWIVAPAMYGAAALVGASRMYNNAHWASDVALGAAIGTFSGLKIVRYTHAHPNNRVDRVILGGDASHFRVTVTF